MELKKYIKRSGLTLEQIAVKMGISRQSLANSLRPQNTKPTTDFLYRLKDAIGCDMADFFEDERKNRVGKENQLPDMSCPYCGKTIKIKFEKDDA